MKIKAHSVFASLMVAILINGPVIANEKVRISGGETVKLEAGQEDAFPVTVDLIVDEVSDISIAGGRARAVAELLLSWRDEAMDVSKARTLMGDAIDTFLAESFDPGVFVANSEAPREVITRSLTLFPDGRVELYEKFAVTLTFETAIPSYPFGDLDLHI